MEKRIKQALSSVHASDTLKQETLEHIMHHNKSRFSYKKLIPVLTCLILLLIGSSGYISYITPVAAISVDINPSIELSINRYDKVIDATAYNNDGQLLLDQYDLTNMNYGDAINTLLADQKISNLLDNDQLITVTVISDDETSSNMIYDTIEQCASNHHNVYCYRANNTDQQAAHELGLSCGKYKAYQTLQEYDSSYTVDDILDMNMKEIQDLIDQCSNNHHSTDQIPTSTPSGNMGNQDTNQVGNQHHQYGKHE